MKNIDPPFAATSFVDCDETNIKLEIKEESLDVDLLFVKNKIDSENDEESIKQEIEEGNLNNCNCEQLIYPIQKM